MNFTRITIVRGQKEEILKDILLEVNKDSLLVFENKEKQRVLFDAKLPVLKTIAKEVMVIECHETCGYDKMGREIFKHTTLYVFK